MTDTTATVPAVSLPSTRRPHWLTAPVIIGFVVLAFWVIVALTVSWWAPFDPLKVAGDRLQTPSLDHLMGTDDLGRDVFTRSTH